MTCSHADNWKVVNVHHMAPFPPTRPFSLQHHLFVETPSQEFSGFALMVVVEKLLLGTRLSRTGIYFCYTLLLITVKRLRQILKYFAKVNRKELTSVLSQHMKSNLQGVLGAIVMIQ